MSFLFNGTASNFLSVASDLITSNDYTIFCYYKEAGNADTWRTLIEYSNTASNYARLRARGNNNYLDINIEQTSNGQAAATTAVVADTWTPVLMGSSGATNSQLQVGSDDVTSGLHGAWITNSSAQLSIGASRDGSGPISGRLAHIAIWSRELNGTERADLLAGTDPATITTGLVDVWDGSSLTGANNNVLVATGTVTVNDSDTPISTQTTIDDITFDIPEWIGLPANDYTLEAEDDNGTVSLAAITFQLPAGWVSQVADGTGGSDADSLAKQFLDAYGITVVAGDVYATNGNTVGADGVPPNATGFTARLYDASASQWTTEYTYVPALVIDSATAGPLQAGDTLTITHSNASASGKTYTIGGLAVTEVSQDATTSVLTIPDPKTYGAKSLSYNTDLPIVVTDGADTASILRQIAPDTGHFYGTVADQAAWIAGGYTEVVDGDNVYAIRTSGTTTPVIASFSFLGPSTWDIYIQQASDNVWGLVGTLTVPTLGAPSFLPSFARFNNQLIGGM